MFSRSWQTMELTKKWSSEWKTAPCSSSARRWRPRRKWRSGRTASKDSGTTTAGNQEVSWTGQRAWSSSRSHPKTGTWRCGLPTHPHLGLSRLHLHPKFPMAWSVSAAIDDDIVFIDNYLMLILVFFMPSSSTSLYSVKPAIYFWAAKNCCA